MWVTAMNTLALLRTLIGGELLVKQHPNVANAREALPSVVMNLIFHYYLMVA